MLTTRGGATVLDIFARFYSKQEARRCSLAAACLARRSLRPASGPRFRLPCPPEAAPRRTREPDEQNNAKCRSSQLTKIVDALKDVRRAIEAPPGRLRRDPANPPEAGGLSDARRTSFLTSSTSGWMSWFAVHDWHIKHLQQPALGRDANGRYTISVMGTQLVMRPDLAPTPLSARRTETAGDVAPGTAETERTGSRTQRNRSSGETKRRAAFDGRREATLRCDRIGS